MRRSLHDPEVYQETLRRIEAVTPDSRGLWGSMSPAQMFSHCAEVQEVMEGKALVGTPWFIRPFGGLMKKMLLSGRDFPKNGRTHPQYLETDPKDFETERVRLLRALENFAPDTAPRPRPHPLFGTLTPEEAGWLALKHLDHHLRQFGV